MTILRYSRRVFSAVAVFAVLSLNGSNGAIAAPAAGSFKQLTLTIWHETQRCYPLEPTAINFELLNPTAEPVKGHRLLDSGYGNLVFFIKAPGREAYTPFHSGNSPYLRKAVEASPAVVKPGQLLGWEEILYYGWQTKPRVMRGGMYVFPHPGDYLIKAVLTDLDRKTAIESNALLFNVHKPEGVDADPFAYLEFLREKTQRDNFLLKTGLAWPSHESEQIVKELERRVSAYPKSVYAKYAQYTLGMIYTLYPYQVVRKPQAAAEMFKEVVEHPKFFLADEALLGLVKHYAKKGDVGEANKWLNELSRLYPESNTTRAAQLAFDKATMSHR